MIDPCSKAFVSCLNRDQALPPENPMLCKNSTNFCCKTDLCNSDENYQEKLFKNHHAPGLGKLCTTCGRVNPVNPMMMQFEFVCTITIIIAFTLKVCVEMPILTKSLLY